MFTICYTIILFIFLTNIYCADIPPAVLNPIENLSFDNYTNVMTCSQLRRYLVSSGQQCFAGGHFKKVYIGKAGKGGNEHEIILKRPSWNALNRHLLENSTWASESPVVAQILHTTRCENTTCMQERIWAMFPNEIKRELQAIEKLTGAHGAEPSRIVAQYYGGCVGMKYGPDQVVAQEGPLLDLEVAMRRTRLVERWPWSAQIMLLLNVLRLLQHATHRDMLLCDFGLPQLGIDVQLNVRLIDLGLWRVHRLGKDAPLYSTTECSEHDDCNYHLCLNNKNPDRLCNQTSSTCVGLDARSWVKLTCHWFERVFVSTALPRSMLPRLAEVFEGCMHEHREKRWSVGRIMDVLHSLLKENDGVRQLARERASVAKSITAARINWIEEGYEKCT